MQYIFTKIVIDMASSQVLEKEGFWHDGAVALTCGAGKEQKQAYQDQHAAMQQLTSQAQTIFGDSSQIFNQLVSSFSPILAAGPGQSGYTEPELATLRSQAITNTGQAYKNAQQAAGERIAAAGGGNQLLPSGTVAQLEQNLASLGAGQTANELSDINIKNADIGRQNWLTAGQVLSGAPSVFNPATSAGSQMIGAGSGEAQTANQISQANNSWMNLVGGALGGITGMATSALTGGFGGGGGGGVTIPGGMSDMSWPTTGAPTNID